MVVKLATENDSNRALLILADQSLFIESNLLNAISPKSLKERFMAESKSTSIDANLSSVILFKIFLITWIATKSFVIAMKDVHVDKRLFTAVTIKLFAVGVLPKGP